MSGVFGPLGLDLTPRPLAELKSSSPTTWSSAVESEGQADLPQIEDLPDVSDAIDCDVGRSPLTNTLPVRRLGLLEGGEAELAMAW